MNSSTIKAANSVDGESPLALLKSARNGAQDDLGLLLQHYRNYLRVLADSQIGQRLQARVSPSDVVQETMLEAIRDFQQFGGTSEREFLGWLRQILINNLYRVVERNVKAGKRDVRREVSLRNASADLDRTAACFERMLASPGSSPSRGAHRREIGVIVADHLAELSEQHREVIMLRNLQGLSFDEVARRMDRTPGAVRMLWLRAMDRFREILEERGFSDDQ